MKRLGRLALLVATLSELSGCAKDQCKDLPPAAEVSVRFTDEFSDILGAIKFLSVEVFSFGSETWSKVFPISGQLADGRTSFIYTPPETKDGFTFTVHVSALDASQLILAEARSSFTATGDGCNFFEVTVVPCKEGERKSCYSADPTTRGVGECRAGEQVCSGGIYGKCAGEVTPAATDACDGKDNDCDGSVDEGCGCTPGAVQACGPQSKGECRPGTQTCSATQQWGDCKGSVGPKAESCDGKDNNCDGQIDEPWPSPTLSCSDVVGEFYAAQWPIDPNELKIFGMQVAVNKKVAAFLDASDPDPATTTEFCGVPRTKGWSIARKASGSDYTISIRGVSTADCPTGTPTFAPKSEGQVWLARGWKVKTLTSCAAPTTCTAEPGTTSIHWLNDKACNAPYYDTCCSCPDGAKVSVEVLVSRQ